MTCRRPESRIGVFVAAHRRNPVIRKLAGVCRRFLGWYGNNDFDLRSNGEAFVLDTLAAFEPAVLFDVGANVGDWTLAASARCPGAEIHAFEIARPTYETLVAATRHLPGVHCRNAGLADADGTIRIRHYDQLPALTTAVDYPHPFSFTELTADVVTGDGYAAEHGIGHIDLLKIDVEGMEPRVLDGFSGLLSRKAVDVVQFEYGKASILSRFLLRDYHALFRGHGYAVGKIFPRYVDFRDYELADEDFVGSNFVACLEDKAEYVDALSGGRGDRRRRP